MDHLAAMLGTIVTAPGLGTAQGYGTPSMFLETAGFLAAAGASNMLATMATAISASIILIVLARQTNMPAIVLLLFGGVILGPEGLGIVQPASLGDGLLVLVSLAIGLILFEGGLTLELDGYLAASGIIRKLLTVGVAITWLGTAAAVTFVLGLPFSIALLAGSLVIVTGPTVIGPLLKRIRIHPRLNHILHWESVLIDPIGVFIAILCFEWISGLSGEVALANFGIRVLLGVGLGIAGGLATDQLIRRRVIPEDMVNVFALAAAVLIFQLAEMMRTEAGLLAVTVAGFVLGLKNPIELKQIRRFKSEITDLLIGVLFILLSARLELDQFAAFGYRGLILLGIVIFMVRPANVIVSAIGYDLNWREKLFLSWMAPRGIVAASMASLFALRLADDPSMADAQFIETFTYSVIVATVILQGFTAGPLARLLKLKAPAPTGWLIVGAHALGRRIARFISEAAKLPVLLIDTNAKAVADAQRLRVPSFVADARDSTLQQREDLQPMGNLLALTDNEDLNMLLCQRWADTFGRSHVFRWSPSTASDGEDRPGTGIWQHLPKPSLLSAELLRGESAVFEFEKLQTEQHAYGSLLAYCTKEQLHLQARVADKLSGLVKPGKPAPKSSKAELDKVTAALYLRREADYLTRSLRSELVFQLDVNSQGELFSEMIDAMVGIAPKLDRDSTLRELREREQSFPTALGHGIAVPHAYSGMLDSRLCAVGQLRKGIEFGAADGQSVRLVFLLISPQGDPEGHLATMAEIARMVVDPVMRERLLNAASPAELLSLIRSFEPR